MLGVLGTLAWPEVPTCADCERWHYDPKDGWKQRKRLGLPIIRLDAPPCFECPKARNKTPAIPSPENELSHRNQQAHWAYLAVKAGSPMPEDETFRRNCILIRFVEDSYERGLLGHLVAVPQMAAAAVGMRERRTWR